MGGQRAKTCPVKRGSGLLSQAGLGWRRHSVCQAPEVEPRTRDALITVIRAAID